MNLLRLFGQFKYRAMRLSGYVTIFNTLLLVLALGWRWWYVLVFALFVILYLFEKKYGIPGELDVAWKNSKEWQEFKLKDEEFKKEVRKWMTS